jgi:hypothetical protein
LFDDLTRQLDCSSYALGIKCRKKSEKSAEFITSKYGILISLKARCSYLVFHFCCYLISFSFYFYFSLRFCSNGSKGILIIVFLKPITIDIDTSYLSEIKYFFFFSLFCASKTIFQNLPFVQKNKWKLFFFFYLSIQKKNSFRISILKFFFFAFFILL